MPRAAPGTPAAVLEEAKRAMADLEDEKAEALPQKLVSQVKVGTEAARAWLHLGPIHLDRLNFDQARTDFVRALGIDPLVELPVSASPKARHTFAQAEKEAHEAAASDATKAAAERERTSFALATAPSRVSAWISGGVALGVLSSRALQDAKDAPEVGASQQLGRTAQQRALAAEVLFGVASAAAITGTILFFAGRPRAAPVSLEVAPLAGGAYVSLAWGL